MLLIFSWSQTTVPIGYTAASAISTPPYGCAQYLFITLNTGIKFQLQPVFNIKFVFIIAVILHNSPYLIPYFKMYIKQSK